MGARCPLTNILSTDEASEGQELPSRAFCKAIDNEQEYDANDVIANGILEQSKEGKPSQQMQVRSDLLWRYFKTLRDLKYSSCDLLKPNFSSFLIRLIYH